MLDPSLLAAVAAVAREGSFERAAQTLHVTPSAVSQRIKLLEERLGAVLIVRGQPCTATETGARLCRHHELAVLLEDELRRDLPALAQDDPAASAPTLRVAVNADSLGTWFMAAMADFCAQQGALLDVVIDDQDHTAEWLRRGHVLAAVTSIAGAVQGCRSQRLGVLRYAATASPGFMRRWFADGVNARTLETAPSVLFNRKDRLQERWVRQVTRRALNLPTHRLPSAQAFVEASLAGIGWGMNPLPLVQPHLDAGRLVELVAGRQLDVPLYWQSARLPVPALDALTRCVHAAANATLA